MANPYTVYRFIAEEQRKHKDATGEFSNLFRDLIVAVKEINQHVRKAGLGEALGEMESENASGDAQKKLDVMANEILKDAMCHGGHLCAIGSEEEAGLVSIPIEHPTGDYVMLFDPLDGSGNANIGLDVGTIFSIRERMSREKESPGGLADVLRPGSEQVAAGYVLYGASTHLVFTTGNGVHHFTYDPAVGEFFLTEANVQLQETTKVFSANLANRHLFGDAENRFLDELTGATDPSGKGLKYRWMKCMVAEVHSALMEGGMYFYPTKKSGEGKIRFLYEWQPMAMLFEQAGGASTDGTQSLLTRVPTELHEKCGGLIGTKAAVARYEALVKEYR
ncbi:MAG: class 1 fructose-bisphosphatase [Patescibacteria group bacterium]|jgi:fructose-1,6-bisphosphatase I